MATPPKIAQLRETDLALKNGAVNGLDVQEAFRRLFTQLNPFFDSINKILSKGISLTDNIRCDLVSGIFTHGVPQGFLLKTLTKASGVVILGCDGQVALGSSIQMVQAAATGPTANVTLYFNDSTAKNVTCSLLLLAEGQQSTSAPTWVT